MGARLLETIGLYMILQSHRVPFHFFPKKDMMFPCPGLPAGFFALPEAADDAGVGLGVCFFDGGGLSSSEKLSQPSSLMVTGNC